MTATKPTAFHADYYYKRFGASGLGTRTQFGGSVGQHLAGATTESAVLSYLANKKHKGCEITLMRLTFK